MGVGLSNHLRFFTKALRAVSLRRVKSERDPPLPEPDQPGWWRERSWRQRLNIVLFSFRCRAGRFVNYTIGVCILIGVLAAMTETVPYYEQRYGHMLRASELFFTILFTIEYALRILSAGRPLKYIISFNGIVDMSAVLPLLIDGHSTLIIRLLRVVRLIKLASYLPALTALFRAMKDVVSLMMMVIIAIILMSLLAGNLIFIVEPQTFHSAFEGTWWSLVTMSTVGYGDLFPVTLGGRLVASVVILCGMTMFAMATAVVSVRVGRHLLETGKCKVCHHSIGDDYFYCPHCGSQIEIEGDAIENDPNFAFPAAQHAKEPSKPS
ncbi:MAG: ion transporter [Mariprofundales bacterium]|nr:ion transporter [Mariprofundales bacterium]